MMTASSRQRRDLRRPTRARRPATRPRARVSQTARRARRDRTETLRSARRTRDGAADAVVAAQHTLRRIACDRGLSVSRWSDVARPPNMLLRPARRRRGGAEPAEEHSLNLAEKMHFRLRSNNGHTIEMATSRDRSGESAQPRHRHAGAGRDRRGDDSDNRNVLAAVQREKARMRGRRARRERGAAGWAVDLCRRRHERQARVLEAAELPPTLASTAHGAGHHGRRRRRGAQSKEGVEDDYRKVSGPCAACGPRARRRHWYFGERNHAVRRVR